LRKSFSRSRRNSSYKFSDKFGHENCVILRGKPTIGHFATTARNAHARNEVRKTGMRESVPKTKWPVPNYGTTLARHSQRIASQSAYAEQLTA